MTRRAALRGYQVAAVKAISAGLRPGGRGQLQAACGTGKTLIALRSAIKLCPSGMVVVACPSLALVAQTMDMWLAEDAADAYLAVCGDETVSDSVVSVSDLPCLVTRDVDAIAGWLRRQVGGRRLIVTTHKSSDVLGEALQAARHRADLLIVDEAHHTAGYDGKHSALLHDDGRFPARRRLYMTATPRYLSSGIYRGSDERSYVSMDDPEVFGPVLCSYPFGQAIRDGWLDDYRIAVVGVTKPEVLSILRDIDENATLGAGDVPIRTAVVQTALAQAVREWDLQRVIAFCPSVRSAKDFAVTLPRTLRALPEEQQPKRQVTADFVYGEMPVGQRQARIESLRHPPDDGWTVLANARCLSEGVDVPAVDAVMFTHPKKSTVDVIQSVGRALRHNPDGSGVATVIVPVLLPDDPGGIEEEDGVGDDYQALWQVVRGLRAHDQTLAAELDGQVDRSGRDSPVNLQLPTRMLVRLPDGYDTEKYLQFIRIRMIQHAANPWLRGYAAAQRYHAKHGHLHVPVAYVDSEGYPLGKWLLRQRSHRRRHMYMTPKRIADLDALGIVWEPYEARWWEMCEEARAYHEKHGHLLVPSQHVTGKGVRLGPWVSRQRSSRSRLSERQRVALDALGMVWKVDLATERWEKGLAACRRYFKEHSHIDVNKSYVDDEGFRLGDWLNSRRLERRKGLLAKEKVAALDELRMVWEPAQHRWVTGLQSARRYHAAHGHLRVPDDYVDGDGYRLGKWIAYMRLVHSGGRPGQSLPPDRVAALEELGMIWRVHRKKHRQPSE